MDPTAVLDTTLDSRIAQYRAELGIASLVRVKLPAPDTTKPLGNIRRLALGSASVVAIAAGYTGFETTEMRQARQREEQLQAQIAQKNVWYKGVSA